MKKIAAKKTTKPAVSAAETKWSKTSLSVLLAESKEKFYALAHRYGLEVKSKTGRWRKTPAVIDEILAAQKDGKGYLPVPRDTTIPETAATAATEEGTEEEPGEESAATEETAAPAAKPKKGTATAAPTMAPVSLDAKNGLMASLCFLEHAATDMLRGIERATEAAMRELVKVAGGAVDLSEMTGELMDDESALAKFVKSASLNTGDLALNALIRASAATAK